MSKLGNFFKVGDVFGYFFRKHDPDRPNNFNLRMMHGINRISMLMFLFCTMVICYRMIPGFFKWVVIFLLSMFFMVIFRTFFPRKHNRHQREQ
ncbi:hypothetical protein BKI52_24655 [marine bacterium AO1-C]|nr:hypothetical protein BKI52_24655 [marine bacterium AO1-C]